MSLESLPGFLPILEVVSSPIPVFLASLSLASIPFLVINISVMLSYRDFFKAFESINQASSDTFDFIVVGGGSSGAVVASRLAENFKVLLLEAGGDPHPLTYIPLLSEPLLSQPMINWQYKTEPLLNCSGNGCVWKDQRMSWSRGKSLGGTSNNDHMVYMRGNPEDFNRWADHTGDDRWKYERVEETFKKLENYNGHWVGSAHHGVEGPMHIEKARFTPSSEYWLEAGKEIGKRVIDPNAFQTEGFFPLDLTQKKGVRFSTYRGYIEPNLTNKNLTIHRYSIATKIHFDNELRAEGVTYYRHAIKQYAKASKEIIIASGAINSPKLLMLSGIGPEDHLNSVGIKPLINLQVGQNLQDHLQAVVGPFLLNKNVSFIRTRDLTPISTAEYAALGKGPFSSDAVSATALIASSKASTNWPDIFLMHNGLGIHKDMGMQMENAFGMRPGSLNSFLNYNANNDSNFVFVSVGQPKSRGYVQLRDSDSFSNPIINSNYFSDEKGEDLGVLLEGINFVVKLYENTTVYKNLEAKLAPNHFPGCEKYELKSQAYWECYVRLNTQTMHQPVGTCSMGRLENPNSVVDSELRVIGAKGLRIADASVMPFITNSDIKAPTIMIGETCADLLKQTWNNNNKAEETSGTEDPNSV